MGTHLCLGVIIWAVFATTVANAEIKVFCARGSIRVTWRISPKMVPHAARFFLGNCRPSKLKVLPSEEGEVQFYYPFADCNFKRLLKGKRLIFKSELTYRPQAKSKPAAFVYPIECVYKRPDEWIPPFLNPGAGVAEGRGGLVFHMALLDNQMTGMAKTNVIPQGSFMPIWAGVEQKSHQPLLLLMEECVAATAPDLQSSRQFHPIISNKGCLLESVRGNAKFLPRYQPSELILYLPAFKLTLGEEVYIHCKLVAWDPQIFDYSKKACHYVKDNGWELLDDPMQSSVCSCCATTCRPRARRGVQWESRGISHTSVLGPLIITDPSDSKGRDVSVSAADSQEAQSQLMGILHSRGARSR